MLYLCEAVIHAAVRSPSGVSGRMCLCCSCVRLCCEEKTGVLWCAYGIITRRCEGLPGVLGRVYICYNYVSL